MGLIAKHPASGLAFDYSLPGLLLSKQTAWRQRAVRMSSDSEGLRASSALYPGLLALAAGCCVGTMSGSKPQLQALLACAGL